MKLLLRLAAMLAILLSSTQPSRAQDASTGADVQQKVEDIADKVEELAAEVDQSQKAQEVSAGLLKPVYAFAELLSFRAFHWVAFTLMVAGVVSFALQLVLTKLVVLSKGSLSLKETLSDALGLAISLLGLVLTTQAATENSSFTRSAAAVISAMAVGAISGFIFYRWGHSQEIQAVDGRRQPKPSK